MSVPTVLQKILARKAEEVAERRARVNLAEVERLARKPAYSAMNSTQPPLYC